jgi:hypothetical protein
MPQSHFAFQHLGQHRQEILSFMAPSKWGMRERTPARLEILSDLPVGD